MKTYKKLCEQMLDPSVVYECASDAAVGKLHRPEVMRFFDDFDSHYDRIVEYINDPNFKPKDDNVHSILDGAHGKVREIEKPRFFPEQVIHHMLMYPFKDILLHSLYEQVYGCLPAKTIIDSKGKLVTKKFGPHQAVQRLIKWVQNDKKTYVVISDVHHAYASVHIGTLVRKLKRIIKDDRWLRLMCTFLHYDGDDPSSEGLYGLSLGHYTSPWLFNFYLDKFDHFMADHHEIKYLRYADNIFLVGTNKRLMNRAIVDMLNQLLLLNMTLNPCTQLFRFEYYDKKRKVFRGRALDALGYVIHPNRIGIRKSTLYRMRKKANKIAKKNADKDKKVTWYDGCSMLSRLALTKMANINNYYMKYIRPKIDIKLLKDKIRLKNQYTSKEVQVRADRIQAGFERSKYLNPEESKN